VRAITAQPERIAETPHSLAHLSRPELQPRPFPASFNASEAPRAEPIVDRPRLQLTPREAEEFEDH